MKAYWATTDIGPFKTGQVVLLHPGEGWVQTGWFQEIKNEWPPNDGRVYVRVDPATGQSGRR